MSQLYLPQHVNALILRDPQTITLQAYKRLAVEALTRHGEDLLANPRTRTDLMRMIGWAMQLSHRGEIEIKPEEKAQFHSLVEQTLEEMSKLDNPYDFIGILRPVLRAGRLLRLKDLDKHAVTILQHAYKHDPDIASRIMNLKFLVDWKIKGSEPLLRSSIELEKNPAVKRYFEELLTVYRKEKRAPDLPLEVKKVIIHAFLEKR